MDLLLCIGGISKCVEREHIRELRGRITGI